MAPSGMRYSNSFPARDRAQDPGPRTSAGFHPPGLSTQPAPSPLPATPGSRMGPRPLLDQRPPIRASPAPTRRYLSSMRPRRIRRGNWRAGSRSACGRAASMRPRRIRRGNPPLWGPGTARHSRPPASAALHRDIIGQGPEEAQHQFAPCYCVFKELIRSSAAWAWSVIGALAWCRQAHTIMGSFSMT